VTHDFTNDFDPRYDSVPLNLNVAMLAVKDGVIAPFLRLLQIVEILSRLFGGSEGGSCLKDLDRPASRTLASVQQFPTFPFSVSHDGPP
jgi:hypothetical protein